MRSNTRSSALATLLVFVCLIVFFVTVGQWGRQQAGQSVVHQTTARDDVDDEFARPKFRLRMLPRVTMRPRTADTSRAARIQDCIARLSEVDHPDYGYSRTLTGVRFLPLPDQTDASGWTITNHELAPSPALRELVAIGPSALPALLDHLSDETPTRLLISPISYDAFSHGGMSFSNELFGNPANPGEADLPSLRANHHFSKREHIHEYRLKVGDLCFVALGQIVGRKYIAVRYQMTACVVINSPTHDRALRERVRQIWQGDDPRRLVFKSLIRDFVTEEFDQDWSPREYEVRSDYELSAALRLLYYFPQESSAIVARKLGKLRVAGPEPADGNRLWIHRSEWSSGPASEFVKRVAWCREPPIRREVRRIFETTTSLDILLAALPAVARDSPNLARQRLLLMVKAAHGSCQTNEVVDAVVRGFDREAIAVLAEIFPHVSPNSLQWFCLWGGCSDYEQNNQALALLLDDRRVSSPDSPGKSARVCDAAASALSDLNAKFVFDCAASLDQRDLQIERLQKQFHLESLRPRDSNVRRDERAQE